MPYTLPNSLTNGTTADAGAVMANFNALLAAANNSLAVDGSNTPVANMVWGGFNLSGVGAFSCSTLTTSGLATLASATVSGNATVTGTLGVTGTTNLSALNTTSTIVAGDDVTTSGSVICHTPNSGSTGGIRLRGNATSGLAIIQMTDATASAQWGTFTFNSSGNCTWSGTFTSSSDKLFKISIRTVPSAMEAVRQLRGVLFRWKRSGKTDSGVIAQEVREVLPHLVYGTDGNLSVNYAGLSAYFIEALHEIDARIARLEKLL